MFDVGSSRRPIALAWLEQQGERRYVESETRIGRGEQNNIRLSHPSVSRDHALIRRVEGTYVLSDLDSANGTFVNDERLYAPRNLATGDRIRLAGVEFSFFIDRVDVDGPESQPESPLATSISQFLTLSGQIDPQNYLEGDLRVVTVLFLDLCGFTALSEKMSPEQITVVVNQCFQHLTETATRFGGFVDKYIGDAMMVLFGAPHTHDDDAERAVRAAAAMQQTLAVFSERLRRRSGIALQMRVGINTGEVLAGSVGSGQFSTFTVMGDTVNVASRLEELADVGRILVSETTARLTRHVAQYAARPNTDIRGKHAPISVYEVEDLQPVASAATDAPLIGRQAELAQLERLVHEGGPLRTALITGPAGSGKSRLVQELVHKQAASIVVRCGEFQEYGQQTAIERLMQRLREARAATTAPAGTDAAPAREVESSSTLVSPDGAAAGIAEQVSQLGQDGTPTLVFDRLDVADEATRQLLERIATQLADRDVLLIVATRDGAPVGWPGHAHVIELGPLTDSEGEQLVNRLLGTEKVERDTLERLMRWSGGWPGVLDDIVAAGISAGDLRLVDGAFRVTPRLNVGSAYWLRMLVQMRLDELSAAERQLLCLGSVMGEPWPASLMAEAVDASAGPPSVSLDRLVELGFLKRAAIGMTTMYDFRDPLTRAVVDASLPQLERRRRHERVAAALQHEYDPGQPDPYGLKQIAMHFAAAGQHWRSVEYLLRSADIAAAASSPEEAVGYYRSLLGAAQAITDSRERARLNLELHERIGAELLRDGSLAEAQIAFEQAADNSASDQRRAELQVELAMTGLRRGSHRRVLQITRTILEQAELTRETRAAAEALMASSLAAQGAAREALEHAARGVTLADETQDAGTIGLARFAAGRARVTNGQLDHAQRELEASLAARERTADVVACAESRIQLGLVLSVRGQLREAEAAVRGAIASLSKAGAIDDMLVAARSGGADRPDRWTLANAALVLGRLLAVRGELARARQHLTSAFRIAESLAARELALQSRLELAVLQAREATGQRPMPAPGHGVVDELRAVVEAALALELAPLACRARVALAEHLSATDDPHTADAPGAREAVILAKDTLDQAIELELTLDAARARRALGVGLARIGFWTHAAREFETALTMLEQADAIVELPGTLVAYARAEYTYAPTPRLAEVGDRLARAMQLAEARGLETQPARAVRALLATHT